MMFEDLIGYYIILFLVILIVACKISYEMGKAEAEEKAIQAWNTKDDGLFSCLTDKQKEKAKRRGIRKAKREDRIAKIINWFSK